MPGPPGRICCIFTTTPGGLLVFVFALAVFGNGLFHLGYMIVRRHYFPGGITAGALVPLGLAAALCVIRHLF